MSDSHEKPGAEFLHFIAKNAPAPRRFADLMRAVAKVKPEQKPKKTGGKRKKS